MGLTGTTEQVETQLKSTDQRPGMVSEEGSVAGASTLKPGLQLTGSSVTDELDHEVMMHDGTMPMGEVASDTNRASGNDGGNSEDLSWEMIGLGLEEPLPHQDMIDDMYLSQQSSH